MDISKLFLKNFFTSIVFIATFSFSDTFHIATTGSDSTGSGSEENPFATIAYTASTSICLGTNGRDTLIVWPGTYNESDISINGNPYYGPCYGQQHFYIASSHGADSTFIHIDDQIYIAMGNSLIIDRLSISNSGSIDQGLFGTYDGSYTIQNSLIIDSYIQDDGFMNAYYNTTLVNNSGSYDNVGPIMNNCILYNNNLEISSDYGPFSWTLLWNNNLTYQITGTGIIEANPLFCDPENGDYTLAENSPAVGAGENGVNMGAFGVGCGRIAQTIHVAITGSDETGDGSDSNPFATIEMASQHVQQYYDEDYTNDAMGWTGSTVTDTILVHDGTYEIANLCH